jgi:hypothetical protein
MTYNMPRDSELKEVQSKNELYFKDFYTVNVDLVCSSINMPPEVAMSKYNSNYSASRAALKDWGARFSKRVQGMQNGDRVIEIARECLED